MKKITLFLLIMFVGCFLASGKLIAFKYILSKNIVFFSFKEGYNVALEKVKLHNHFFRIDTFYNMPEELFPNGIWIDTVELDDSFEITDPVLIFAWTQIGINTLGISDTTVDWESIAVDSVLLGGDDIGKSSIWYYIFAERNDLSKMKFVQVYKPKLPLGMEIYRVLTPTSSWDKYWLDRSLIPSVDSYIGSENTFTTESLEQHYAIQPIELSDIEEDSDEFFKQVYKTDFKDSLYKIFNSVETAQIPLTIYIGTLARTEYGIPVVPNRPAWVAKVHSGFYLPPYGLQREQILKVCYKYLDNLELICGEQTNILEEYELTSTNIYPNPGEHIVSIDFNLPKYCENVKMYIRDVLGQTVLIPIENAVFDAGKHTKSINVDALSNGVYYIIIEAETYLITQPLTIIR